MKIPRKIEKITTDSEQEIASQLLDNHNEHLSSNTKEGDVHYAFISVGAHHKMFTLWTFFSLRRFKPDMYIKTLSNNLVTAVEKAIERYPTMQIFLDQDTVFRRDEEDSWKFLNFGKYRDRHIDELIIEDPEYVTWLLKENQKRATSKQKLSKVGQYLLQNHEYIWEVWTKYRTKQAEEIVKTNPKQFIGVIGNVSKFEVVVRNIFSIRDFLLYKMEDKDGNVIIKVGKINNKFISIKGTNNTDGEVEVGDILKFSSDVRTHDVSIRYPIGEKQTKIGRISKF
jgi:hypothetical protein